MDILRKFHEFGGEGETIIGGMLFLLVVIAAESPRSSLTTI